jgi:hypothetical protein
MMILDSQYRIDADNYGYMLYRDGGVNTKGVPIRLGTTYHSTIGQALQGYYAAVQRDTVRGGTMTLPEAMGIFTTILDGVRRISDRLDEGVQP